MSNASIIGLTFGVYLLLMFVIGRAAYRRTRSHAQSILGGRSLGPWVVSAG